MKRAFFGVAAFAVVSSAGVSITAFRHEETIAPNVKVGPILVGGLTPDEAAYKLRVWWEGEKVKPVALTSGKIPSKLPSFKPNDLGVTLDDQASISQLPRIGFLASTQNSLTGGEVPEQHFNPVFKPNGVEPTQVAVAVKKAIGDPRRARATYAAGNIVHKPEVSTLELDTTALQDAVTRALVGSEPVELPLREAPKRVPDEELAKVRDVMSSFSTKFSAGNRARSANLKLATTKIDGWVLAPGEQFSFNESVGQRTAKAGFKVAGVYVNGRHDVGIGGGICQVSTTLYNAALHANLKIVKRSNHSMPVPYVPVGHDATVNWGGQDLVIENDKDHPVAISGQYAPGTLTFRILGIKDPTLSVKIERTGLRSFGNGSKTVVDSKLAPGTRRVIEKGSTGYSCTTYRVVYQNGQVLKKESLGRSHYPGGKSVIAVGPARSAATPVSTPPPPSEPAFSPNPFES